MIIYRSFFICSSTKRLQCGLFARSHIAKQNRNIANQNCEKADKRQIYYWTVCKVKTRCEGSNHVFWEITEDREAVLPLCLSTMTPIRVFCQCFFLAPFFILLLSFLPVHMHIFSNFKIVISSKYLADWQRLIILSRGADSKAGVLLSSQMQEMALHHHQQQHHHQHPDGAHYDPARNHPLINSSPPILPNPMSALSQLNPQVSRSALPHGSPSPPGSKSATPSPSSSNQEEETDPHSKVLMWLLWAVVVGLGLFSASLWWLAFTK